MAESLVIFIFGVVVGICGKIVHECYEGEGEDMAKKGKGDDQEPMMRIPSSRPLHDRMCELECTVEEQQGQIDSQRHDFNHLTQQGAKMAEDIERLKLSNERLKAAAKAREERDVAQDAVKQQNITLLSERVAVLEAQIAAGGLSPEDAAAIQATINDLDAVTTSLEAADPTPPVVEA